MGSDTENGKKRGNFSRAKTVNKSLLSIKERRIVPRKPEAKKTE